LLSFSSPCLLPILPAFLVVVAGSVFPPRPSATPGRSRWTSARASAAFLAGFGVVFVLAGSSAFSVAHAVRTGSTVLQWIGGIVSVLLGVHLIWSALRGRSGSSLRRREGLLMVGTGVLIGAGFAAAWTPCIGPVLASILLQASFPASALSGVALLSVFTLGLLTPFLLLGLVIGSLLPLWITNRGAGVALGGALGAIATVLGLMLATGRIAPLTAWLTRFGTLIDLGL
jgi:cytochrome c-type biogenesis protein